MNLLFEIVINQGFILDLFGVIGLGLVGLAAVRLARRFGSPSATTMTWGAIGLIVGRLGILLYNNVVTPTVQMTADPLLLSVSLNTCLGLLTAGLGAIVWGFWRHERDLEPKAVR